ncbi:hypothetical protein [Aegicerativicinus sediminis]
MRAVLQILNFDDESTCKKALTLLKDRIGITDVRTEELTGRIILNTKSYNSLEGAKSILENSGIEIIEIKKRVSSRRTNRKSD